MFGRQPDFQARASPNVTTNQRVNVVQNVPPLHCLAMLGKWSWCWLLLHVFDSDALNLETAEQLLQAKGPNIPARARPTKAARCGGHFELAGSFEVLLVAEIAQGSDTLPVS